MQITVLKQGSFTNLLLALSSLNIVFYRIFYRCNYIPFVYIKILITQSTFLYFTSESDKHFHERLASLYKNFVCIKMISPLV